MFKLVRFRRDKRAQARWRGTTDKLPQVLEFRAVTPLFPMPLAPARVETLVTLKPT